MQNPCCISIYALGSFLRGRRGDLLALLAEFAHDLCDIDGAAGRQLGLLLQLLLPDDDGAEAGPPVPCVLLQLGITGRWRDRTVERRREGDYNDGRQMETVSEEEEEEEEKGEDVR